MKLKTIAALFASLLFAFAIAACDNDDDKKTEAPADSPVAASPVASEEAAE